jgi:hypothetical protein
MTKLDPFTLDLLTNPEVLAVNQASVENHQVSNKDGHIVWSASAPNSHDKYIALFNAQDNAFPYDLTKALYRSPVIRKDGEVADISVPLAGARNLVLLVTDGGDNIFFDHADWIEPALTGPKGVLKLTTRKWTLAKAGWGEVRMNRSVDDKPITFHGETVEGIGTHSVSMIEFDIPEGFDTFKARGILSENRPERGGSVEFVVLTEGAKLNIPDKSSVSVSFGDLGITGKAIVRDLWKKTDLGEFSGQFSRDLPIHGAGLYRVTPQP